MDVLVEYSALNLDQSFTYTCEFPVQPGCRVKVNFNNREVVGMVTAVDTDRPAENIKPVLEVIDEEPLFSPELQALAEEIARTTVSSHMAVYKAMLPPALKPAQKRAAVVYEDWFVPGTPSGKLTKKGQAMYEEMLPRLPMKASEFRKITKTLWKSMLEQGDIVLEKREKQAQLPVLSGQDTVHALTADQQRALQEIHSRKEGVFLLHGVTGSGKTEVFLQLAQEALEQGKQVLFLVPEIGLTPMMIERVTARFGDQAAIYHSRLSAQEKYDQYMAVKSGRYPIVIGTRSAVFMPFANLGLILMDEEHDASYKQDNTPRYHARDAAVFRAQHHGCRLVLASATPSLESYARALRGVYTLVKMPRRVHGNRPAIYPVDLRTEDVVQDGLSGSLIRAIQDRLNKKEQVILLLNRRGYHPSMRCLTCQEVILCPDCALPMAYHKRTSELVCHVCGRREHFDFTCPKCGSHHFSSISYGTEKMEETLHSLFPSAHVVRMDADSTRGKHAHAALLKEFQEKGDILLGTQMVAKGLDFERVSLVGILLADNALIRQDYRAAETAYELIEQAAGRSGRSQSGGEVLIQTFDPSHYVLDAVLSHSYKKFFVKEMQYRHLGQYPPYLYLCSLVFSHKDPQILMKAVQEAKKQLAAVKVLGPVDLSMRMQNCRMRLLLKEKDQERLLLVVWNLQKWYKESRQKVRMEINMNPMMLEE